MVTVMKQQDIYGYSCKTNVIFSGKWTKKASAKLIKN